jgi:hypothetical protein
MTPSNNLPSPMDFPDEIKPIMPADLPTLWSKFGFGIQDGDYSKQIYLRHSVTIAAWTGHEHTIDKNGKPFTREQWHDNIHRSLSYLNRELGLGMNAEAVDVLALCYTALQGSPRYRGDPLIRAEHGENTAVHSLHTMLQAFLVYRNALEKQPELGHDINFFRSFQTTCLMMAVHDLGEMFGEAGSLAQVGAIGNFDVKDKTETERLVFNYGVRLAVRTVIDRKNGTKEFFRKMDRIGARLHIQNQGAKKSDQQMAGEVGELLKENPSLSPRGRKLLNFMKANWECVEKPANSLFPFQGYLASTCERVQGTRHLKRMLPLSTTFHHSSDGIKSVLMNNLSPGYRMKLNCDYTESPLGWMCHFADPESPVEKAVAREAAIWVYGTLATFFSTGPEAFFIDPSIKELKLHEQDGTPYSPDEVSIRLRQIEAAKKVADLESSAIMKDSTDLGKSFQNAARPMGSTALCRNDVVAMYLKAAETGYMPNVIKTIDDRGNPVERGTILIRDRPAELAGYTQSRSFPYPDAVQGEIEKIVQALR